MINNPKTKPDTIKVEVNSSNIDLITSTVSETSFVTVLKVLLLFV